MPSNPLHGYPRATESSNFFIQDLGTADFCGLDFVDTAEDLLIPNQNLTCKPNVLIEGSTMVIDYGDCGSARDKDFIDVMFKSMSTGNGFTFSNAIYNDVVNAYSADLSASCTLNNYTDYKIMSTYTNIGSTTEINYYTSSYFETSPQISTAIGLTSGVTLNQLVNYTTSKSTSFVDNNFVSGDYVDINTTLNKGRFTIGGVTIDSWGREIISFQGNPTTIAENLKGTEVIVNHFRKIFLDTNNPDFTDTVVHIVNSTSVGGKNYFTIDGTIQKELILLRGSLYIFVEESYPSHVMAFSETPDGTHNGGSSLFNTGMYTVVDNSIKQRVFYILPNNNTPDQVYYYGTLQAGMGSAIKVAGVYSHSGVLPSFTTSTSATL